MSWGTLGQPVPGGYTADPSVLIWNLIAGGWQQYNPGVNSETWGTGTTCWGPELQWSRRWRHEYPNRALCIVKQTVGSTGVANTASTDWSPYSFSELFDAIVKNLNLSLSQLSGNVISVNWIGNEQDALTQADAEACQQNMIEFERAIRAKLYAQDASFVISRLTNDPFIPYGDTVRRAQEALALKPGNFIVNTDDMPLSNGHYVPSDVLKLGDRMFDAHWNYTL